MRGDRDTLTEPDAKIIEKRPAAEMDSERRRDRMYMAAVILGPILLLAGYFGIMYSGLRSPEAWDYAQLGRNIGSGKGFTTYVLRPLTLAGSGPLNQPDTLHGPLFPLILATAFVSIGVRDSVAAGVSGFFYLLSLPLIHLLGARVFNRRVGLAAAFVFAVNSQVLDYAISGTPITLSVFLLTWLFLTLHHLAAYERVEDGNGHAAYPRGKLTLAGLLTGALYLTDPLFFWTALPIAIAVMGSATDKRRSGIGFLVPLLILTLPWMIRNLAVAGNPFFGMRWNELWMDTHRYPAYFGYRIFPEEMIQGVGLFNAVVFKILTNIGKVIVQLPHLTMTWILAFLLPSLFFHIRDHAANSIRRLALLGFLGIFLGNLLFIMQLPYFVAVVPALLVFAVSYLFHLIEQTHFTKSGSRTLVILLGVVAVYPLFLAVTGPRPQPMPEARAAVSLSRLSQPNEVILTDRPGLTAWYAGRPSLWIPANDDRIRQLREVHPNLRWLFLTEESRAYSTQWQSVYNVFHDWNLVAMQDQAQGLPHAGSIRLTGEEPEPLLRALSGFTSVYPLGNVPSVVAAVLPPSNSP